MSFRSPGRGRYYSRTRTIVEASLRLAYHRSWPARLWGLVPGATRVHCIEHRLELFPPDAGLPPLRIAFASDLHLGPTTPRGTLDNAFALLRDAAPDLLVLGGDYVFLEATPALAAELEARIAAIPAATRVAVLGNHDLWTHHELLEAALARAGVTVLVNGAIRLPPPHDQVAIIGLDEPWTGTPDAAAALEAVGDARVKLAVSHSPEGVPHFVGRGITLLLCGHTHGGQLALPGPRPIVVPGRLSRRWPWGLHRVEDMHLFVSRGIGGVEVPMRTFAPPDVAVITLV